VMRIGPTSHLCRGAPGRFFVWFLNPTRRQGSSAEIVRDRVAAAVRGVAVHQVAGGEKKDGHVGRRHCWELLEGDGSNREAPHPRESTTGTRKLDARSRLTGPARSAAGPRNRNRPAGTGLLGSYVQNIEQVTAWGQARPRALPVASKSGTTTLDNAFSEVLSFPKTQTMAQRNGFEMEEP
jgi:hypothetical protein